MQKNKKYDNKRLFNPFPGLRAFSQKENHIFFGREKHSDNILNKIIKNKFTAVLGASGSGKSSLIYCGVIPMIHSGMQASLLQKWKIITTFPGNTPIKNLAQSLIKAKENTAENDDQYFNESITNAILSSSSLGLVEVVKLLKLNNNENILILVDQFEELFRYNNTDNKHSINESYAFVKLLVKAINQTELPIHIVITMRSDFIGECSEYQELTDLINSSYYLVPKMDRDDLRKAIEGPIAVGGGTISDSLINQLLNDIGTNADQLPILQHALMRTWDYWILHKFDNEPININHYNAIGGMEKALSEHANESYNELSSNKKKICENIFKTLTEKGGDNRGIRHPSKVSTLANISETTNEEIIEIANIFRKTGRSFILPSDKFAINSESIIDLSHESLMRIWDKLKIWVEEEKEAVQMYLRLSQAAKQYQEGTSRLWKPPDLLLAENWKKTKRPSLKWGVKYNAAFERTMVFLDTSIKEFEAEEKNKIMLQKRTLKRSRIFALILGAATIFSLGFVLYSQTLKQQADKQTILAIQNERKANYQSTLARLEQEKAKVEAAKAYRTSRDSRIHEALAKSEKENAELQQKLATNAQLTAEEQRKIAEYEKLKADSSANEAYLQRNNAQKNAIEATLAKFKALGLRMLSISQSMAIKSIQLNDNYKEKKALLALQSFKFNKTYNGIKHNPDIYSALYISLQSLNSEYTNTFFKGHTASVKSLKTTQNKIYSTSSDGSILMFDINDANKKPTTIFYNEKVNLTLKINENNNLLACGNNDSEIRILNLQNNKPSKILKSNVGPILDLVFIGKQKKIAFIGTNNTLNIWDIEKDTSIVIDKFDEEILTIAVSPNQNIIAGGTKRGNIYLWNRNKNYKRTFIAKNKNSIHKITFSNDGTLLASGDTKGKVVIWNLISKKAQTTLEGNTARITDLIFSPNNNFLAISSLDRSIQLWDTKNFNNPPIVLEENSWVLSMDFTNNSKELFVGLKNGNIHRWSTEISNLAVLSQPN